MRLGWFVRDAFRALTRTAVPTLTATLTVVVTAVVLPLFVPVVQATEEPKGEHARVVFDVYLRSGTAAMEREKLRQRLVVDPHVKRVEFISEERALAELRNASYRDFPRLTHPPTLDLLRVTPLAGRHVQAIEDRLVGRGADGRRTSRPHAIDGVRRHEERTGAVVSFSRMLILLAIALGTPMVLASIAVVANAVRLSVFVRRREVEVMRLVGATSWFIRGPFVVEGVLVGLAAGLLAVGVLAVGQAALVGGIFEYVALLPDPRRIDVSVLAVVLPAACVATAAIGSALVVRRFVRV